MTPLQWHRLRLISFGGIFCLLFKHSRAWCDKGHMITMAIAEEFMHEQEIANLSGILNLWQRDYPEMSGLVSASVWADHIKCAWTTLCCSPTAQGGFDGLNSLDSWHYANIPWFIKPANDSDKSLTLDPRLRHMPFPGSGAHYWLQHAFNDLTGLHGLLPTQYCFTDGMLQADCPFEDRANNHTQMHRGSSSPNGLNFLLRTLIHILADVHQPLHSATGVSKIFPYGDSGGQKIAVTVNGTEMSLHKFLDTMAGGCMNDQCVTGNLPEIYSEAQRLLKKFPLEVTFEDRLKTGLITVSSQSPRGGLLAPEYSPVLPLIEEAVSFDVVRFVDIVRDSADIAGPVYDAIYGAAANAGVSLLTGSLPVAEDVVMRLRDLMEQQIVLAGYRIAKTLQIVLQSNAESTREVARLSKSSVATGISFAWLTILASLCCVGALLSPSLMRRVINRGEAPDIIAQPLVTPRMEMRMVY